MNFIFNFLCNRYDHSLGETGLHRHPLSYLAGLFHLLWVYEEIILSLEFPRNIVGVGLRLYCLLKHFESLKPQR